MLGLFFPRILAYFSGYPYRENPGLTVGSIAIFFNLGLVVFFLSRQIIPKSFNKRATAELMEISQTGWRIMKRPQFLLVVSFFTEDRQKIFAKVRTVFHFKQMTQVHTGAKIEILYQENRPENIVLAPQEEPKHADPAYASYVAKEKQEARLYRRLCLLTAAVGVIGTIVIGLGTSFGTDPTRELDFMVVNPGFVLLFLSFANMKRPSRIFTIVCLIGALAVIGIMGYMLFDIYVP